MHSTFAVLFVSLTWIAGIAGCVYLTMHDHPLMGLAVLLLGGCASYKHGGKGESDE